MSTLKADTIQSTGGGAATLTKQVAAKVWLQYNASHAIQGSFNVSSLADGGTGRGTTSLTSSMANDDYSLQYSDSCPGSVAVSGIRIISVATGTYATDSCNNSGAYTDGAINCTAVFGDLA